MNTRSLWILLCSIVLFTACGDDKEKSEPSPVPIPELPSKKLTKVEEIDLKYDKRIIYKIEYSGDTLSKFTRIEKNDWGDEISYSVRYKYKDNKIIATPKDGHHIITYFLDDKNKITKHEDYDGDETYTNEYKYNSDGYLISQLYDNGIYGQHTDLFFEWRKELLTTALNYDGYLASIIYYQIPDKLGLSLLDIGPYSYSIPISDMHTQIAPVQLFYQLGYLGKKCPYLILSIYNSKGNKMHNYSYELDDEGYVTKMINSQYPNKNYLFFYDE